jgi:hypothetical protein
VSNVSTRLYERISDGASRARYRRTFERLYAWRTEVVDEIHRVLHEHDGKFPLPEDVDERVMKLFGELDVIRTAFLALNTDPERVQTYVAPASSVGVSS